MKLLLERITDNGTQTIGRIYVLDKNNSSLWNCPSLELSWNNNERRESCIPVGKYQVKKHNSPRFGKSFWVQDVPGRSEILLHPANYHSDLLGCIAPGSDLRDINNDGHIDVTSSKKALAKLLKLLPYQFELEIKNGPHLVTNS